MGRLKRNSMFPEAFPLPQEQGGTTPSDARPDFAGTAPPAGRCEYHTAISAAFQLELANAPTPPVDSNRGKVQTFDDSTALPDGLPGFAS